MSERDPLLTVDAIEPSETPVSGPRAVGTSSASGSDLAIGQVFASRYEVQQLIGRGGMGSVWRVRDRLVGEVVALKALHIAERVEGEKAQERTLERFRREVRLARRITSAHVARTHDLGSFGAVHYLTMEYVDGSSLSRVLDDDRVMAADKAARIASQIASGLAAAHSAGVVHRDLKPDNVLVERLTSRVVVTDFGIARALHDSEGGPKTGGVVGTPMYMAPEQVAGAAVDERADLYALGLVLFEMLTGAPPYWDENPIAAAVKRLQMPAADPRDRVKVPDTLAEIVLRCLQRDPRARFPDAGSLARALAAFEAASRTPPVVGGAATVHDPVAPTPEPVTGSSLEVEALVAQGPSAASFSTPSTTGGRAPVAPLLRHDRGLAVLPFVFRGASDQDWLASGIRDELIDVLSRTRGLRVLGRGAVDRYRDAGDPRELGRALGVDFVVEGTAQLAGPLAYPGGSGPGTRLRVTVRLVEVESGLQLWSERFDSDVEDLLAVQERVAQRIAEALRVGLHGVGSSVPIPQDMLEIYFRARRALRTPNANAPEETAALLEKVIAAVPDFGPAYAAHAIACLRAWFLPGMVKSRDWRAEAQASVARALERAPDLAETHYAKAQLASQDGRFREAVEAARSAIAIAPTLAEAHQYLAALQLEAGRAKEALARLDLALALEPTLTIAWLEKARWNGLYGDIAVFDEIAARWEGDPTQEQSLAMLQIRVGAFRRDPARVRRGVEIVQRIQHPTGPYLLRYAQVVLGELDPKDGLGPVGQLLEHGGMSSRMHTFLHQMCCEGFGSVGMTTEAMHHFKQAAESALLDLEWVERCPFLAEIRKQPEFSDLRKKVRARCEEIWSV